MKLTNLGPLIREGSAKDLYWLSAADAEHPDKLPDIAFRFTSWFSVFDVGRAAYPIWGKDRAVCACAVKSFQLAKEIGVPTHFVEQLDDITIRVKQMRIISDRNPVKTDDHYVVPAEWIYRLRVAGSILRDFTAGNKSPYDYGLPAGIVPAIGTPFPYPVHQFTTKFEALDREIGSVETYSLAGISPQDQREFWSMIDRLTGAMALELSRAGLVLIDGKMECLMGPERAKMIGDVFGTPDEDRFCPADQLEKGRVEHYSKEYLRQWFIEHDYYKQLNAARKAGQEDPPIPSLPRNIMAEVSRRYLAVAEKYAGAKILI